MAIKRAGIQLKPKNVYLTSTGLEKTQAELNFLRKVKRQEVVERIKAAREFGDVAENSEYNAALEEQEMVENRISELEEVIRNAKLIKHEAKDVEFVTIGSTVKVEMDGEIDEFTIVGRVEADPSKKRISNESPLGSVLLGVKKGEVVEVTTPIVKYKCKVIEIK